MTARSPVSIVDPSIDRGATSSYRAPGAKNYPLLLGSTLTAQMSKSGLADLQIGT
ncbi:MAG: hypothetical protein J7641_20705 [Cyanobacteria bacterium SID2]|nr:hypothetical protein [Cyanobacteria bacterium SID2]MBP0006475.1 hypothetical protein [Cyanobacteria bacterium SBC]